MTQHCIVVSMFGNKYILDTFPFILSDLNNSYRTYDFYAEDVGNFPFSMIQYLAIFTLILNKHIGCQTIFTMIDIF